MQMLASISPLFIHATLTISDSLSNILSGNCTLGISFICLRIVQLPESKQQQTYMATIIRLNNIIPPS